MDLIAHPSTPARFRISAELGRTAAGLHLTYEITGDLSNIVIPPTAPPVRTDELWLTTCFELFVQGEGRSYREFNFSPSGAWAAYSFDDHRTGMRAVEQEDPEVQWEGNRLDVLLPLHLSGNERVGLSAIVEVTDGARLFFALAHPPGEPDFHHQACFAATVPPIEHA
jgi:hypothetical protein